MAKKHRSLAIHIILLEREGTDCVGKQSWEVEERGGKKKKKDPRALFMLCMRFAWLSGQPESDQLPHHTDPPLTEGRRKARKKT